MSDVPEKDLPKKLSGWENKKRRLEKEKKSLENTRSLTDYFTKGIIYCDLWCEKNYE